MSINNFNFEVLGRLISQERLQPYLSAVNNDREAAVALYLQNLEKCQAFYKDLHWLEIVLRNAINEAVIKRYGRDWLSDQNIIRFDRFENAKISEAKLLLENKNKPTDNPHMVAELNFGFWVGLLGGKYEDLWRHCLSAAFRNRSKDISRKRIHGLINNIRHMRNRIAHYEPIFHLNPGRKKEEIDQVLNWIDPNIISMIDNNKP